MQFRAFNSIAYQVERGTFTPPFLKIKLKCTRPKHRHFPRRPKQKTKTKPNFLTYSIVIDESPAAFGSSSWLASALERVFGCSGRSSSFSSSPPRGPNGKVLSQFWVDETCEITGIWTEELLSNPCSPSSYWPRVSSCSWFK